MLHRMPARNTVRQDFAHAYYHVYARGVNKETIFREAADKDYFLYLLARHLSVKPITNSLGYTYPHYRNKVELLSYCLMGNHFHLLIFQSERGALSALMKSIMISYTSYAKHKYERTGPLFESRFKASLINKDAYLLHVSRYIHLNPRSWKYFPYSSLRHIRNATEPEWLQTERLLELQESRASYAEFVADYEENKLILEELKHELANL
jgi:putative transposase